MIRNFFFYTITFLFIVMFCSFAFVHPSIANGQAPDNTQNSYKLELKPQDVTPDVTWEDWRPKDNTVLTIKAVIVAVTGTTADITSTTQYTFTLSEVSDYKGYCMNFGAQSDDKKDIYFRQSDQPKDTEQLKYSVSGKNGETLKVTCESSHFSIPIFVFVDDYGAHGILDGTVSLNDKKDENGRELDTTPSNNDTASGRLSIPKDNNGNDIADGWESDVVKNYDPWVDKENGPGINMNSGDGFTTFEEYRGFMVKGEYRYTDPVNAKDLFIYSDFTEGYGYASNLPGVFSLYEINQNEMATNRRVSINSCGSGRGNYGKSYSRDHPHQDMLIDGDPQSAVHVQNASGNEELEDAYPGVRGVVVKLRNVPYKVKYCLVFPKRIEADLKDIDKHPALDGYFTHRYTDSLKSTIGHEIGHCMCLVHPTVDKLKKDYNVQYGVSIMEGHTVSLGPDATDNEKRNLQAAVVNARHRAGYVYPAALHTTTYKLVFGSDTQVHHNAMIPAPARKTKPQWVASTNSIDSTDNTATIPTTPTIPGVPTDVTTTASNGMVTLSWTAPTDDGGGIDKYQYRVDKNIDGTWGDWIDVPSDGTSLPLSVSVSVENGVDYAFQVLSNNSAGSSMQSVTSSALPVDPSVSPPSVPGMLSATPSDGQVRLSWDEPGTGTPVIAYEYTYDESNDGSWSSWKRTTNTGTSHDVTGLTNDTIYAFKVRARNTGGIGTETSKVTATPFAYTVPGKIRDLAASLTSDNKVRLDWKAPLDDGGSPITHYDYRKDTYNDGTWTIWYSTGDSSTDEIFYSVIPGVTYAFRIRAVNTAGPGSPSDSVVIRVPTVPSVPLTLSAELTSAKRVLLDWAAPADDGGSPITRYDYYIYADDGHGEQWLPTGEGTLTQKSWPGAGFSAGLTYTFKVRAVNAIGIGTETEAVTLTIPANTTPSAPLPLTASEGNASVYLSWNEPADDGYVVVRGGLLKYQYRYRQSGGTWNSWSSEQWDRYATQSNLTNGTTYEFEVHAVNDVGTGTAASVSATPTGTAAPGVPQYFDTDGDNGSVDLWWEPPEYDGGSSITDYEYRYKQSTRSSWNGWTSAGNADEEYPEFTVTGLTNGTSYDFQVRARNAVGPGAHTETLTETPTAQTPETPTGVSASAGTAAGTINLTWTAPDDGGSPITNYKVRKGIFQNNRWTWTTTAISIGSANTSYTVTGLQSGGLYRFRVRAVNSVGESSYSRVAQSRAP